MFIDYQTLKKSLVYAIIFVFLYACTDEIHQAFVPGRACAFTDVMIDTAGGLLALFFIMITNEIQRQTTKKA